MQCLCAKFQLSKAKKHSQHTYGRIRIRQLFGITIVGLQRERLPPVESQDFREGCGMVLRENFAITAEQDIMWLLREWTKRVNHDTQRTKNAPDAFVSRWGPLQRDGVGNHVCDGELAHFEGGWQDCTLRNNKDLFATLRNTVGCYCEKQKKNELCMQNNMKKNCWYTLSQEVTIITTLWLQSHTFGRLGPCEISFIFNKIQFFSVLIFLDSVIRSNK